MSCKCYDDDENGVEKEKRDLFKTSIFNRGDKLLVQTVDGNSYEEKIVFAWDDAICFLTKPKKNIAWDKVIFLRNVISITVVK